jgi:hypothetical protein
MLGDSHSGPTTTTRFTATSPTRSTMSYSDDKLTSISRRTAETLTSASGAGLLRRSEVRRRTTPRTALRTYTTTLFEECRCDDHRDIEQIFG